jgi:hypothetical protein
MSKEPPQGMSKPSLGQVVACDKQMWVKLAESTRNGIVPVAGQRRPLDEALEQLILDAELNLLLLATPRTSGSSSSSSAQAPQRGPGQHGPAKRKQNADNADVSKRQRQSGPGKPARKRWCWRFNSKAGCQFATTGNECKLGFHVCKKCGGDHSMNDCKKAN